MINITDAFKLRPSRRICAVAAQSRFGGNNCVKGVVVTAFSFYCGANRICVMAQSVQNVTVFLTLPISCQICLGKVRKPVVCGNYHVFCSACIELWLTKSNHCPTCRILITPANPCREIIGATNETECNDSASVKKKLRKTRFELLLRDFEEEIKALHNENEELRKKNMSTEEQLKICQQACPITTSDASEDCKESSLEERIDSDVLEEWEEKLGAATATYEKVQLDLEKMKEANRTLRAQNVDLVRENLWLKAEVDSRSPQKFGRYTVAALEAKISQYERDVDHLRKALERSDKYIEELESRVSENESKCDKRVAIKSTDDICHQTMTDVLTDKGRADQACHVKGGPTRIVTMRKSLSEMGNSIVCTKPDSEMVDLSGPCGFHLTTAVKQTVPSTFYKDQIFTPDILYVDNYVSSVPSTSMSCLSLKSPNVHIDKRTQCKPLSYLRKLSFDDCCSSTSVSENKHSDTSNVNHRTAINHKVNLKSSSPLFWGTCSLNPDSPRPTSLTKADEEQKDSEEEHAKASTLQCRNDCKMESLKMSSEVSMDAAYFDKVSELDSMMSECENYKVPHYSFDSTQSSDFDISLMQELDASTNLIRPVKFNVSPSTALCGIRAQIGGTLLNPSMEDISCAGIKDPVIIEPLTDISSTSNFALQPHEWSETRTTYLLLSGQPSSHLTQVDDHNLVENDRAQNGQSTKRKTAECHDVSSPSKVSKLL
ncbi:ORC ubiquitin ligase 1-like isoform X1 [Paramormyrops kingsleyae]|uniref:ORC ubiquitin ligase 1-like isoform X1 n=2 Tax=Paramormyrops kingsleyae TaxID=1676925 RepID=UPI003B96ED2C